MSDSDVSNTCWSGAVCIECQRADNNCLSGIVYLLPYSLLICLTFLNLHYSLWLFPPTKHHLTRVAKRSKLAVIFLHFHLDEGKVSTWTPTQSAAQPR